MPLMPDIKLFSIQKVMESSFFPDLSLPPVEEPELFGFTVEPQGKEDAVEMTLHKNNKMYASYKFVGTQNKSARLQAFDTLAQIIDIFSLSDEMVGKIYKRITTHTSSVFKLEDGEVMIGPYRKMYNKYSELAKTVPEFDLNANNSFIIDLVNRSMTQFESGDPNAIATLLQSLDIF